MKHIAAPRFILGALFLLLLCAGTASAQLFPGRITGAVRDAQGAAVTGATVKLTNPSTGLERTEVSDQNGEFNFPELALGTFTLTITKDGFQTTVLKDIVTSQDQVVDSTTQCVLDLQQQSTWFDCHNNPANAPGIWWDVFPIPSGLKMTDARNQSANVPGFFKRPVRS